MIDSERFKLLYGPNLPPKFRIGDTLPCERRGREVRVCRITDALIQWPASRGGPLASPILCGDLICAVQRESAMAVAHHWGVLPNTVGRWRKALGVEPMTHGSRRLRIEYAVETLTPDVRAAAKEAMHSPEVRAKLSAAQTGRPLQPKTIAALLEAARRPKSEEWKRKLSERTREMWQHPEEHGLPSRRQWTDKELSLLGTDSDTAIAAALGLSKNVVEHKRRSLEITRTRDTWSEQELAQLGTISDAELARKLRKSKSGVQRKREELKIPPFLARWTAEEIALLGTASDSEVARKLGRDPAGVLSKRLLMRIPPSTPRWTKAEIALLGTDSDRAIAQALGRTDVAVSVRRKKLRIPAYC